MPATWVADAHSLAELIETLQRVPRFAIDTEFHRERTYYPHLALVQVAWDGGAALIDPLAVDVSGLAAVFDAGPLVVAHAADQDLEVLATACGSIPQRLFDTQIAAGFLGMPTPSLGVLAEKLLDRKLVKGDRLTDWTVRPLSDSQLAYAETDVAHLLEMCDRLCGALTANGRIEWALQECVEVLGRARAAPDPDTVWWRLKDSRSLRGKARGVAQEVAAWRERTAAAVDRPPRTVLADLALQSICQSQPTTVAALRATRGMDGRQLRDAMAESLLEAVRRGQHLDVSQIRVPPAADVDRQLRPAVALAAAWVSQLAHDLRIDGQLLATRADLARFLNGDPDARLAKGWRVGLVGEPVRRLVEGRAAVAFRPGRGDIVLEERSGRPIIPPREAEDAG